MHRKWVENEGKGWVRQGIISEGQYTEIVALYPEKKHAANLFAILGGILVGLGILSFVAANWQTIPQLVRLGLILLLMLGFYGFGHLFFRRGQEGTGTALIGVGLISFGAGIFLTAQMYQLSGDQSVSLLIWSLAGTSLMWLYRSRFMFILSLVIVQIGQISLYASYRDFSFAIFAVLIFGLSTYAWRRKDSWMVLLGTASIIIQSLFLLGYLGASIKWSLLIFAAVYTFGDWMKDKNLKQSLQGISLVSAYIFAAAVAIAFNGKYDVPDIMGIHPLVFIPIFAVLLMVSVFLKRRNHAPATAAVDWIIFLPLFYVGKTMDIYYLLDMSIFSLAVLLRGYKAQWRNLINAGTALFLISILIAYGKLVWGFMNKSIFFIIGGAILFGLSWLLNRQKNEVLKTDSRGEKNE